MYPDPKEVHIENYKSVVERQALCSGDGKQRPVVSWLDFTVHVAHDKVTMYVILLRENKFI